MSTWREEHSANFQTGAIARAKARFGTANERVDALGALASCISVTGSVCDLFEPKRGARELAARSRVPAVEGGKHIEQSNH